MGIIRGQFFLLEEAMAFSLVVSRVASSMDFRSLQLASATCREWREAVEDWWSAEALVAAAKIRHWESAEDAPQTHEKRRRGPCKILAMNPRPDLRNFVYGEVELRSLLRLLKAADLKGNETFADLGCGAGRQLLGAAAFGAEKVIGYELMEGYYEAARRSLGSLGTAARIHNSDFTADVQGLEWLDADVILVTSTCFDDHQIDRIAHLTVAIRSRKSRIITLDKPLKNSPFTVYATVFNIRGDWGQATAYLHRRRSVLSKEAIATNDTFSRKK